MPNAVDLYDSSYANFAASPEAAVRRETYGEDLGQSSWLTADEWRSFVALLSLAPSARVLEVGSGSGGPAVYLARTVGCHVTGVDVNAHGVANAAALARSQGVSALAEFRHVDASGPLPFPDGSFDAVVSNDAMCHIPHRQEVLRDWHRLLAPNGRMLFTDAMVVTGVVSHEEIAARSAVGQYFFVPPGENERLIRDAGFELLHAADATENAAVVSKRWHDARARHRDAMIELEGEANFTGLQRFLACVHTLSAERRLSRWLYVAGRQG